MFLHGTSADRKYMPDECYLLSQMYYSLEIEQLTRDCQVSFFVVGKLNLTWKTFLLLREKCIMKGSFLCTIPWRDIGGVEEKFQTFKLTLDGGEWLASCSDWFTPEGKCCQCSSARPHSQSGRGSKERNPHPTRNQIPVIHPTSGHFSDWGIPVYQ
jgi:hypothetical protein